MSEVRGVDPAPAGSAGTTRHGTLDDMTSPPRQNDRLPNDRLLNDRLPEDRLQYHRLGRIARGGWWRPVAGTVLVVVGWAGLQGLLLGLVDVVAGVSGQPPAADGTASVGALGDLAVAFLSVALLLPVVLLAARWTQARSPGTLSSVTGRLRWRWLLRCLPVATAAAVVVLGGFVGLAAVTGADTGLGGPLAGWPSFLAAALVLILVVPVQAAAEEYAFRGWLLQAVGGFVRRPWLPIAVQAVLFAAVHGWGTPWGFADLVVFAVAAGVLTVRTGGLEAAVALHLATNLGAGLTAAVFGQLSVDETAADAPWQLVLLDLPVMLAYTLVVLGMHRRARTTAA